MRRHNTSLWSKSVGNAFFVSTLNLTGISRRFNLVMVAETGCQQLFLDMIITVGSHWNFIWKKKEGKKILMRNGPCWGIISRGSTRKIKIWNERKTKEIQCREMSKKWSIMCFNGRYVHSDLHIHCFSFVHICTCLLKAHKRNRAMPLETLGGQFLQ